MTDGGPPGARAAPVASPAEPFGADAPGDPYRPAPAGLPRACDIAVAGLLLVVTGPILLLAMLLIRLETPGPAIYRQLRVGWGGWSFELLKLRTMGVGNDPVGIGTAVAADDPRVTHVGRALRRTSLDELPNLINVLRGEMAIVGPRPTIPAQVAAYEPAQHRRHAVRPGITGWAQINGRLGIDWDERIRLDLEYVENRSLRLDLRIIARTVKQVLSGAGLDPG